MAKRFEELNLPVSVVSRIVKEALPNNVAVGTEARSALARAGAVYILYLTSASNSFATKENRRTINGDDVLQAVAETGFDGFVEPLRAALEDFKHFQKEKKEAAVKRKTNKGVVKLNETVGEEEMNEEAVTDEDDE